ncbi:RNA-binding protein 26 isoform X2 [Cimex lectularius]|uniref:RNA-binding protein 26 n=1 Tax=Cimex lectularius TaxID=79782 RepID=A0A8I6S9X1_CIMLE|nr:RNA-binding protein 26 isoform X2 [Cimex lectularius]
MIIEDPEGFKAWLTSKLEPLCDADPAALAKYVYALVKKDKPVEELRASMLDQLEVFLQRETQGFVNLLFRTLETQCFDPLTDQQTNNVLSPIASKTSTTDLDLRETFPSNQQQEEIERKRDNKESNTALITGTQNSFGVALLATAAGRRDSDKHLRKSESDKEDRNRRLRRRGSSVTPERRRSRSRSFERRRSRSRERDRGRAWRNKSPPPRRYERRRSYSKSPTRRFSKSRSPQSKRIRFRNRSPPRSRSRTPLENRERKDVAAGVSPRDNNHGDTDLRNIQSVVAVPPELQAYPRRCRDFDEKGFCMRGDLCPYDHGTDPVILEDVGVPMYNGGPPQQPPIIPQVPPPNLMHHPTPHPPLQAPPPIGVNIEYNPDAPSMEPRVWGRQPPFRGGPMLRGMTRGTMGRGGFPLHQRELINVVTAGGPQFRHQRPTLNQTSDFTNGTMSATMNNGKSFDYNRVGGNRTQFSAKGGNTTLQLKKVPSGVNNITHLNNHFSKFGKIVNIQVGVDGDPESALITFSNHTEANIAIKSTEAVLNNRFIRVFWYNSTVNANSGESKQENIPPATRPSVLERLGAPPSKVLNNIQLSAIQQQEEKVTLVNNSLSKTLYIPSAMKKEHANMDIQTENKEQINTEVKKKLEEITAAKKKQEEARKAGIKLNADLRKRKQELLEKQLNQQKLLIQRTESPTLAPQQKAILIETIKTLQESIENIRKDLASSVKNNLVKSSKRNTIKEQLAQIKKTREEVQRELLDAELDLINRQHEGKNTDELKKKVADLKLRVINLGLFPKGPYRGRSSSTPHRISRGRGRSGIKHGTSVSFDHNVVDHRPTKLLVSGYEQDDKAEVIKHFEQYGEIVDYISDDATPSLVLNFKLRKDAEVALTKGRNFHDRLLSVTWATHNNNIRSNMVSKPATPIHRSVMVVEEEEELRTDLLGVDEEDEEFKYLPSPTYLFQDEECQYSAKSPTYIMQSKEEDEEDEDRSWRR